MRLFRIYLGELSLSLWFLEAVYKAPDDFLCFFRLWLFLFKLVVEIVLCLFVVNPNTLGGKPRLSYINLISEPGLIYQISSTQNLSFFQPLSIQHHCELLSSPTKLYSPTSNTTHDHQHSKHVSQDLCNYHQLSLRNKEPKFHHITHKILVYLFSFLWSLKFLLA